MTYSTRPVAKQLMHTVWSVLACVVALLALPAVSQAQSLLRPADLNPGDEYRIVFVTESVIGATSTSISTYNDFVSQEVSVAGSLLSGLETDWAAIASTATVDAIDNTGTDPTPAGDTGVPIYLPDGITRVVPNYDLLWSGVVGFSVLEAPIHMTQTGSNGSANNNLVWTGTSLQGLALDPLGANEVTQGFFVSSNSRWVQNGTRDNPSELASLYGISGVLVAVPEPTSAALMILVMVAARPLRSARL